MTIDSEFFDDEMSGATIDSLQDRFAAILLAASASDGCIAEEEMSCLTTLLCRMKLYSEMSTAQFGSMMDRLIGELERQGVEALTASAVAGFPSDFSETVYINAVDVVLADRVVEDAEREFLERLRSELRITPLRAEKIFNVMKTKNEG